MSVNLISDDCLLHIFKSLHDVHSLFRCLRVCKRWNRLVNYRLLTAKWLIDLSLIYRNIYLSTVSICYNDDLEPLSEPILSKILKKSPRLKVACIGYNKRRQNESQKCIDCLVKLKSLEGLILSSNYGSINNIPGSVKSLSCRETRIMQGYYPHVRHLIIEDEIFSSCIHRFPNVEWLNLNFIAEPKHWFKVALRNKHGFKNVIRLEIDTAFQRYFKPKYNLGVLFTDFCPQLESAHLRIPIEQLVPNAKYRNKNLTNLVITFKEFEKLENSLSNLRHLLKRFPNVKHLSIKYMYDTFFLNGDGSPGTAADDESNDLDNSRDSNYEDGEEPRSNNVGNDGSGRNDDGRSKATSQQKMREICRVLPMLIIHHLPKLVLLDMRDIAGIDELSNTLVILICRYHKRTVKFYYGDIPDIMIKHDWPELFDEHCDTSAFKFMSTHFLDYFPDFSLPQTDL